MNYMESVNAGLAAFHRATEAMLSSRTILVFSVLQVKPRGEVAKALAEVEPEGRKPSDSTVRRMIARTTQQMGLSELPTEEKGGRPSFETCDNYKQEHCAKWIAANGGMPRLEQLADPDWDLKPYPPAISSTRPAFVAEAAATMLGSQEPNVQKTKKFPLPEPFAPPHPEVSAHTAASAERAHRDLEQISDSEVFGPEEEDLLDAVPEMPTPFKLAWNDLWSETWKDQFEQVKVANKLSIPASDTKMRELSLRLPRDRWVCKALLLHARAHGIPLDPSHYLRYLGTIRQHYKKLLKQYWKSQS